MVVNGAPYCIRQHIHSGVHLSTGFQPKARSAPYTWVGAVREGSLCPQEELRASHFMYRCGDYATLPRGTHLRVVPFVYCIFWWAPAGGCGCLRPLGWWWWAFGLPTPVGSVVVPGICPRSSLRESSGRVPLGLAALSSLGKEEQVIRR